MKIRDRIVELRRVPARDLIPNPKNWRTHPKAQQEAMQGILAEVGYADALLARETPAGLQIIDGHMATDEEYIEPLQAFEAARHVLRDLSGLPSVTETGSLPEPGKLIKCLRAIEAPNVGDIFNRFMALTETLGRLRAEIALALAYRRGSPMANQAGLRNFADVRWAHHYGVALVVLYAAWNQVAHLLNEILCWGLAADKVIPASIKSKGRANAESLRDDTLITDIVDSLGTLAKTFAARHFEAHERGHGSAIFESLIDILNSLAGKPAPQQADEAREKVLEYEDERNAEVTQQYTRLVQHAQALSPFFDRHAEAIASRHPQAGE